MTIPIGIHGEHRLVPICFERACRGDPHAAYPDIDNRGSRAPELGPVVAITAGTEIVVQLTRVCIDPNASLFVTSSDPAVTVTDPADGKVPTGPKAEIHLRGVTGGTPKKAALEVRFGSITGVIIQKIEVWCYQRRTIQVTPHMVTIAQVGGLAAPVPSTANVANIRAQVQAVWQQAGIHVAFQAVQNENVTFATAGIMSDSPFPGELATLLNTNHIPNTINVYFVHQIGLGGTLGYGISRPSSVTFGTGNPGIVLGDQTAGGAVHTTAWAANDLAHEIGHFLQLWHPNNLQPPNEREDTWCRRMLMHNYNSLTPLGNWKDDVGYGAGRRGSLITLKHIPHITTDAEVHTSRAAVSAGPY